MNENDLKAVGERFRELRLAKGWSQTTCARRCGFANKASISRIESGVQGIRRSKVEHVAEVLGTTPEYLMGWKEEAPLSPELQAIVGDRPLSPAMRELLESVQTLSDDQCEQITDFMNYLIEKRTK